jgi:hypothetical protein
MLLPVNRPRTSHEAVTRSSSRSRGTIPLRLAIAHATVSYQEVLAFPGFAPSSAGGW